ncbi:digestive organ expansion factor [Lentinula aff. detonsa]|uniref:U3 small nucleolar RNA-associated protein 25 n=1 Tax=Lentinula aff. detonsa TaxID=2804958 RepID=A0AA38NKT1_9AGAR|nr:digestive organ expansion factor [Lentinula aff. detonsa]
MVDENSTTTRLLTLLNVSATKAGKKKWEPYVPADKLNKRKSVRLVENESPVVKIPQDARMIDADQAQETAPKDEEVEDTKDPYEQHFGSNSVHLGEAARLSVDKRAWNSQKSSRGRLGSTYESTPVGCDPGPSGSRGDAILDRLKKPLHSKKSVPKDQSDLQNDLLSVLSTHRDLYLSSSSWENKKSTRQAISLHLFNHITKKRRRVLKNNERISNATKAGNEPPEDVQDQGFTRPSVLILLPFRSSALAWFNALTTHTPSPEYQIENYTRFTSEYGLPSGAIDKLATAEPGTYPQDHVETFKGNVDDNFRVGIKLTRKSVKAFTEFYGCDIIIASPLGLRQSIQKEKNADYLSSIEMLVMDQLEALAMQNWDHVKFVLDHLNKLPKESHDTDFSRTKPWYLDGHSEYLRQSILLSAYETPETRQLYNASLKNVAGKIRTDKRWSPIEVPAGIDQNFVRSECGNPKDEADKRFNYFTTQLLPIVLKSAVQSSNTVIFVPSYFDFVRVHNHFRKLSVSFTVLSEYSTNQEISRGRQAFFAGQKSFLIVTERFHFYKRYKIRGIRNIIFYGPPDHPQFYSEYLSYPFLDDGVESSDITCRVLYSKYDWFRLERIAGTEEAIELTKSL